jgi:5-methyltetrahydrofolate--homocysteine methyltransferase
MVYPGVPIVNSINGKEKSLKGILPLVKRFGCFIVAPRMDESGIHREAGKRIAAGDRLVDRLISEGIDKNRIIVDALMLAESAEPGSAMETLDVVEHFAKRGLKVSVGLSNISFGLPERKHVNNTFLKMAMDRGLSAAITNPATVKIIDSYNEDEKFAFDFLTGKDPDAARYIARFRDRGAGQASAPAEKTGQKAKDDALSAVYQSVGEGNIDSIEDHVREALKASLPQDIMDRGLLAALETVGQYYSTGEYFLPQMLASANTMKKGFLMLKPLLSSESSGKLGRVVICTVKGDIHDIGKNIVAMMMENHGFEVHDLGKDVASEVIISSALEIRADIICLSSLLTTTMGEMKTVKEMLEARKIEIPVMVGGAVVNEDYARSIGAHYSRDAVEAVKSAKALLASAR